MCMVTSNYMVIGEVYYLICKRNRSKNLSVQQISTLPKAPISYWLETTFFYFENAIKLNYSKAGREKGLVRSDLARTFSDLNMTWLSWLPYCAGVATSERAKLRTVVRDQKPRITRVHD
jgi:hypothetical protein